METLDDACGGGTSEMDFTVEDYLSTIEDAVELLESYVGISIPAEQAADVCEVRGIVVVVVVGVVDGGVGPYGTLMCCTLAWTATALLLGEGSSPVE